MFAPAGQFRFNGNLVVPRAVTLQGCVKLHVIAVEPGFALLCRVFGSVPSHGGWSGKPPQDGTVFLPYAGRNKPDDPAFITLNEVNPWLR